MRFRDYVLEQLCCVPFCRAFPVDPDHNPARGARGNMDHDLVAPLCHGHHVEKHAMGINTFERRYGIDLDDIIDNLWNEYATKLRLGRSLR